MYKRVLLKISGEALKGDENGIFDTNYLENLANIIRGLHNDGTELAIVIGAGNIWRGKVAVQLDIDRVNADYMGMLGTVINAVTLSSYLEKIGVPSVVFSAVNEIDGVVQKYDKNAANLALKEKNVVFLAGGTGKPFFTTDTAATMRAIELNCEAILMGKNGVKGVYDSDPSTNPGARFFKDITFDKIIELNLSVMDQSAVELIKDQDIDIRVFSMNDLSNFKRVISGEDIGTRCHRGDK